MTTLAGPSRRRLRARLHHFAVLPVKPRKRARFALPASFLDQPLSEVADDGSIASHEDDVDDHFDEMQREFENMGNRADGDFDDAQVKAAAKESYERHSDVEVVGEITTSEIAQARGVAKVLHLFSGIGELCDRLADMFIKDRSSVVDYSMAGEGVHMLMDTAGWEK